MRLLSDLNGSESDQVAVSFIGWGREYDDEIPRTDLRVAVEPFDAEIGKKLLLHSSLKLVNHF